LYRQWREVGASFDDDRGRRKSPRAENVTLLFCCSAARIRSMKGAWWSYYETVKSFYAIEEKHDEAAEVNAT